MPSFKNNHYVPLFLLRQFQNGDARGDCFVIAQKRLVKGVSLRNQCSQDYFYGRDGAIEKAFSQIEDGAKKTIDRVCCGLFNQISDSELTDLRLFVLFQLTRTAGAAKVYAELDSEIIKELAKIRVEVNGANSNVYDLIDRTRIALNAPQLENLKAATQMVPAVMDLSVKFLVSKNEKFVLGDNPAVVNNQFAEHHVAFRKDFSLQGLALKGVQIFLPVGPSHCIALFDGGTYQYGKRDQLAISISRKDVNILNLLQIANAGKCVFRSPDGPDEMSLKKMLVEVSQFERLKGSVSMSEARRRLDGRLSRLMTTRHPDIRTGKKFSFSQVTDCIPYAKGSHVPPRSVKLVQELKQADLDFKKIVKTQQMEAVVRSVSSKSFSNPSKN